MTFKVPEGTAPTKAEKMVRKAYDEFCEQCSLSPKLQPNMRFRELVDLYFDNYASSELKGVTKYNYRRDIDKHMMPVFGNRKICDICSEEITRFLHGLNKSSETSRKFKIILSSVFNYALKCKYIRENPCTDARYKKNPDVEHKIKYLTLDQCRKLMVITEDYSTVNTIIRFLLLTGVRIGECFGLSWDDISFDDGTIHIHNTLGFDGESERLTTPKTKSSNRYITLSDMVRKLLLKHKAEQDKLKEVVGEGWEHPETVFTTSTGHYYSRSNINLQLKRLLTENDLPPVSVHALRHTNASLYINNGANLKLVSEKLGHCNIEITGNIYSHLFAEYEAKMAKDVEDSLSLLNDTNS